MYWVCNFSWLSALSIVAIRLCCCSRPLPLLSGCSRPMEPFLLQRRELGCVLWHFDFSSRLIS